MAVKKKSATLKKKKGSALKKNVIKKMGPKRTAKKVGPVQKGYHSVTPCLTVNTAAKAIEYYKKVFGAKEVLRMERQDGKIAHAELKIGDAKIMLADECPEMNTFSPKTSDGAGFALYLYIKDVDAVVKRAVAAGAELIRPVENMFYGDRSGIVEDPFGHKWHIATHVENVSNAQVKKRAAELFSKK